jgi:protein SCO1
VQKRVLLAAGAALLAGAGALLWSRRDASFENDLARLGRDIDDVTLTTHFGARIAWRALKGQPRAVFFGFTHCPVICPVTIYELTAALDRIGVAPDAVGVHFISVDPERDTPERLRAYFEGFGPRVTGFTGAADEMDCIAQSFRVVSTRTDAEDGGYTIDHTATVFLLDANGRVKDVIAYGSPPDLVDQRLSSLLSDA